MRRNRRGQVLVVFLMVLAGLLGLAALGIETGYFWTVRHELQRSADAAALAGASAFLEADWTRPAARTAAETRARAFAARNPVAGAPLDPAAEVEVSFPSRDRVGVRTARTVRTFFSRMILGPSMTIAAQAVAEASVVDRRVKGLKPWGIPYPWEDLNGNELYDPGEPVHTDCPEGVADPSRYFCQGTRVILKIGTPFHSPKGPRGMPSLQQEAGHFFALDFGSGASGYREAIAGESALELSVGDAIPVEPGDMVGPTRQGVAELIARDPDSTWNAEAGLPDGPLYAAADGSWMNSPRVVRIPLYDPRDGLPEGKAEMTVAGFGAFWIESVGTQGTVIGRYLPARGSGLPGPSAGPAPGPRLRVLRLVE